MKYYTWIEPDKNYKARFTTWSEERILEWYFSFWAGRMAQYGLEDLISTKNCIDDFIVANSAWETDAEGNGHAVDRFYRGELTHK